MPEKRRPTRGAPLGRRPATLYEFELGRVRKPAPARAVNLAQQTFDVTTAPNNILPTRANRRYFLIQNLSTSASIVYVAFGSVASSGLGFELPPGNTLEMRNPAPADTVSVVVAAGSATVRFVEG